MAQVTGLNTLNSLDKYGVPIVPGSGLGILMPKLKHRFRVLFNRFGNSISLLDVTRQVATVGRPSQNFSATELHSYNNIAYIAQKPVWSEIQITLRDDISNLATSAVSAQVQKQMNHYTQSAAATGSNYKFTTLIETLDGSMNPNILETWKLEGCYVQQVEYDSLDYSSSEVTMITMTIRYDNALQGNEASFGNQTVTGVGIAAATIGAAFSTAT